MWLTGPVAPRHVGSSQTRARTRVPRIGRQTLNHCATREAPTSGFIIQQLTGKVDKREDCSLCVQIIFQPLLQVNSPPLSALPCALGGWPVWTASCRLLCPLASWVWRLGGPGGGERQDGREGTVFLASSLPGCSWSVGCIHPYPAPASVTLRGFWELPSAFNPSGLGMKGFERPPSVASPWGPQHPSWVPRTLPTPL